MKSESPEFFSGDWAKTDAANLAAIRQAYDDGKINSDAKEYLELLYSDGMRWFFRAFKLLGRYLGPPKHKILRYNFETLSADTTHLKISDINPLHNYIVYHRLDQDPVRNQFFGMSKAGRVDLLVSSIITMLISSQKKVARAIEKVSLDSRYYREHAIAIASARERAKSDAEFDELTRKIIPPYKRLKDVYRVKCLFDIMPQLRAFVNGLTSSMPDRIIAAYDKFYSHKNQRNYRDSKIIIDIGQNGVVIPLEIICQVRTFFDFENASHDIYVAYRKGNQNLWDNTGISKLHEAGVWSYNEVVCDCTRQLFDRIGWNILYNQNNDIFESLFDGFPRNNIAHYPRSLIDSINAKLAENIESGNFAIENAPRRMSNTELMLIFEYMAAFVLSAAMPYANSMHNVAGDTMPTKFFNFVMAELSEYYKTLAK
ncbi:MAG: hypothetical protein LBB23_02115 [Rickettsiales bacterium]|jgi:hypothetical protein|nr:hypothetical protein [Rickettsiales bacterium]